MQYEFSRFLVELLQKSRILQKYGLEASGILSALKTPEKQLEISRAPAYVDEWLASPICFEIAKAARVTAKVPVEAVDLVEVLCETAADDSPFVLRLGGKGFVNATPTETFIDTYLTRVIEDAGRVLRHFQSIRMDLDTADARFACALPPLSWNEMRSRALLREDGSDARALAELSKNSEPDWNRALMLLSLLADEEIALEPYLGGLAGRQNTPWYIERFRQDAMRVSEVTANPNRPNLSQAGARSVLLSKGHQAAIDQGIERVLSLRWSYLRAQLRAEPELLLAELLDLIRSFYTIYNDPTARRVLLSHGEGEKTTPLAKSMRRLIAAISAAVFDGLGAMDAEFHKDSQYKQYEDFLRE